MKKVYFAPELVQNEAQVTQMLAESLPIKDTTLDGNNALTKEYEAWDIWDTEE